MKWCFLLFLLAPLLVSQRLWAEPASILTPGAIVYDKPDFDADHLFALQRGEKIEVSHRNFGPFHRIRTFDGRVGFIADNDYLLASDEKKLKAAQKAESKEKPAEPEEPKKEEKHVRQKPLALTRFRGPSISYVGYREQTMGGTPLSNSVFYGFKMAGPNVLVDGDMVTEFNVDILPGAPVFYQEATGNSASGFVLHTDLLVESVFPHGRQITTFAAFGPMFKYDHYGVSLNSGGHSSSYDLEDMIFGAVFEVGFNVRLGSMALRGELKYDWEKAQYWGLGTSLLFPF